MILNEQISLLKTEKPEIIEQLPPLSPDKGYGCKCEECGKIYQVDLIIPDRLWEKIKPQNKPQRAGLLCGACIMRRIESIGDFDYWFLTKNELNKKGNKEQG